MTRKRLYTSIGKARYEELISGWLDGSLQDKWNQLPKDESQLTKKQRVEGRQIRAIALMIRNNAQNKLPESWHGLQFFKDDNGITLQVI